MFYFRLKVVGCFFLTNLLTSATSERKYIIYVYYFNVHENRLRWWFFLFYTKVLWKWNSFRLWNTIISRFMKHNYNSFLIANAFAVNGFDIYNLPIFSRWYHKAFLGFTYKFESVCLGQKKSGKLKWDKQRYSPVNC